MPAEAVETCQDMEVASCAMQLVEGGGCPGPADAILNHNPRRKGTWGIKASPGCKGGYQCSADSNELRCRSAGGKGGQKCSRFVPLCKSVPAPAARSQCGCNSGDSDAAVPLLGLRQVWMQRLVQFCLEDGQRMCPCWFGQG